MARSIIELELHNDRSRADSFYSEAMKLANAKYANYVYEQEIGVPAGENRIGPISFGGDCDDDDDVRPGQFYQWV
jgi:hypothetical protein